MHSSTSSFSSVSALRPLDTSPTFSYRERARRLLHLTAYRSGLSALHARLRSEQVATILMYHSIPTLDENRWIDPYNSLSARAFEQQMRFLALNRNVISIEQLVQKLAQQEPIERGTVVITFDDGYLNNLTVAAPILAKYTLPATIYLATNYVSDGKNQWVDTLYAAFRSRTRTSLLLTGWDNSHGEISFQDWNLSDQAQCVQAHETLCMYLIQADTEDRNALLAEIDRQLQPAAYPPRLVLNWEEARVLRSHYPNITLGVHTSNHLDLSTHGDKAAAEMASSIEHMISELGDCPKHLAFPYNRYCAAAQAEAAAAGLDSAVLTEEDPVVRSTTSPYALPRLEAPKSLTMLKSWTDGGFPDVSARVMPTPWICPY